MKNFGKWSTAVLALVLGLSLIFASSSFAQDKSGIVGWEQDSAYNSHYELSEYDYFKGYVEEILEITPMAGMTPGIGLVVRDQDGDMVNVQLGPKSFVNVDSIGLKKGDKVKVKGVWADIDGNEVFIASKVKKGEDVELKVRRTKDGVPFWTMPPEQLAKETSQEE